MPKVSIVLPTYNGEKYIRESIDSILKQTFTDWELIIVNDCSNDSTDSIISQYEKVDKRIRTIRNERNQKLPRSLNIGFKKSCGEYLTWTSDDNIYLPEALEVMVEYLDQNKKSVLVCTGMNMINSNGEFICQHCKYTDERMLYNDSVGACFMYKRCVLKEVGEYNPERFLVEDYDYWLRILFFYGKIDYIDRVLYLYRLHEESLTGQRGEDIYRQLLNLREDYIEYITNGLTEYKATLYQVYYELIFGGHNNRTVREAFLLVEPEIANGKTGVLDGKMIVYGAGCFGKKAYEKYNDRIVCYIDKSESLVGKKINNVEICSMEILKEKKDQYSVLIAVGFEKIFGCITELKTYGVNEYYVFKP